MKNEDPFQKLQMRNDSYYSAPELAKLFRANESTIKRWADSGKLKCFKTPGGHRKFTPEHVSQFISSYNYEIISPNFTPANKEEIEVLDFLILKGDYRTLSEIFFGQSLRGEKDSLMTILRNAQKANIPLMAIYDEIVGGAIRKVFRLESEKRISRGEILVVTQSMLETLLQFRMLSQRIIVGNRLALSGCVRNGNEEIVTICGSHLLEISGWKVLNLGTNLPVDVLIEAMKKYRPALTFVSTGYLNLKSGDRPVAPLLMEVAQEQSTKLLFSSFDQRSDVTNSNFPQFSSFRELLTVAMQK